MPGQRCNKGFQFSVALCSVFIELDRLLEERE